MEALRCLKRRLSDAVFQQLTADATTKTEAGPGGHSGATLESSAASPTPAADSSDKSLPGPATSNATRPQQHPKTPSLTYKGAMSVRRAV
jgi:transposase